ncbi:hypothetical protein HYPSUDRAFT_1021632 [Hypholoma sublateritium FD-334 SS-4]|uniref:Uncharacterized protein n=1 Tax=Hypholoma sublateritium (strain FD-334 SS-4) TaxID=945553 RepID=A0A0D2KRW2_HYPSF|nr:hypothetical protein HYPSUDRAFT_1021632 [Hypholoma sublateritium FD-334 SS-4]
MSRAVAVHNDPAASIHTAMSHNRAESTASLVPDGSAYRGYLINILLLGVYTPIYFATLHIYLRSKASRSPVVIAALTALYLLNAEQTAIQWSWTSEFLGMAGAPQHERSMYTNTRSSWDFLLTSVNAFLAAFVADALLIWRCYNVWNRSVRVILLPLALLLVETGTTPPMMRAARHYPDIPIQAPPSQPQCRSPPRSPIQTYTTPAWACGSE